MKRDQKTSHNIYGEQTSKNWLDDQRNPKGNVGFQNHQKTLIDQKNSNINVFKGKGLDSSAPNKHFYKKSEFATYDHRSGKIEGPAGFESCTDEAKKQTIGDLGAKKGSSAKFRELIGSNPIGNHTRSTDTFKFYGQTK